MKKFEIAKKKTLTPEIGQISVYAPLVAAKARAGQFIILRVDAVIMALGTSSNPMSYAGTPGLEQTRKGCVAADEGGCTSCPNIFAGGDAATGAATVILAMGAGKSAAKSIDQYLKSKG